MNLEGVHVEPMEETQLLEHIQRIVETQEMTRENTVDEVASGHQRSRNHARREELPHSTVSDFVLGDRETRHGQGHTVVRTWGDACRAVSEDKDHQCILKNIVPGDTRVVHVGKSMLI